MEIREIEAFDLYGDGTLVLKTNVEGKKSELKYAWYIKKDGKFIFKSQYQLKNFIAFNIDKSGKYIIKAFVLENKENKIFKEIEILINSTTSPKLIEKELSAMGINIIPVVEFISGPFWKMKVSGKFPKNSKFAWYIYKRGQKEPIFKQDYSLNNEYIYKFEQKGEYKVKAFIVFNGNKCSKSTDWFKVKY